MKRAIAGFLLLIGMAVSPAFAFDGSRGERRDIQNDQARFVQDCHEYRRDLDRDHYVAARNENRKLRRHYRDVNRDRRELNWDRH
jgi:hypothetical protein